MVLLDLESFLDIKGFFKIVLTLQVELGEFTMVSQPIRLILVVFHYFFWSSSFLFIFRSSSIFFDFFFEVIFHFF